VSGHHGAEHHQDSNDRKHRNSVLHAANSVVTSYGTIVV
jgi:hypothetical protein